MNKVGQVLSYGTTAIAGLLIGIYASRSPQSTYSNQQSRIDTTSADHNQTIIDRLNEIGILIQTQMGGQSEYIPREDRRVPIYNFDVAFEQVTAYIISLEGKVDALTKQVDTLSMDPQQLHKAEIDWSVLDNIQSFYTNDQKKAGVTMGALSLADILRFVGPPTLMSSSYSAESGEVKSLIYRRNPYNESDKGGVSVEFRNNIVQRFIFWNSDGSRVN